MAQATEALVEGLGEKLEKSLEGSTPVAITVAINVFNQAAKREHLLQEAMFEVVQEQFGDRDVPIAQVLDHILDNAGEQMRSLGAAVAMRMAAEHKLKALGFPFVRGGS